MSSLPASSLEALLALDGELGSPSDASAPSFSSLLFSEDSAACFPSFGASEPPEEAAASAKVAREKALAVKRRRAHRERVKTQGQQLKSQLVELSAELQRLRRLRGDAGLAHAARVRIWRSISTRQKEARTAAASQNRKLKAQVLHRQTQLRGLFQALERRPLLSDAESKLEEDCKRPVMEPADSALFDAFLDELDAAYAETDDVLRASGVAALPEQSRSQKVTRQWDAERGSTVFELVDARVLPFSFVQTRSVLWQSIVRVHCRYPQEVYSRVENQDNTIAVKCLVDCHVRSKNETAPLIVYLVLRRYTEAERTVLVWRALSEGRGSLSGLYSDETGWTVLRPKTGSNAAGDGATTMETCTRFEPICSAPSGFKGSAGSGDADLFTTLLVNTVDQDNQDITHLMADLILKDLLGAHLSSVELSTDAGFSK